MCGTIIKALKGSRKNSQIKLHKVTAEPILIYDTTMCTTTKGHKNQRQSRINSSDLSQDITSLIKTSQSIKELEIKINDSTYKMNGAICLP
jgi:hypothetical protein